MLLRSSSTPILGSLLRHSESPNHFDHKMHSSTSDNIKMVSFGAKHSNYHPLTHSSSQVCNSTGGSSDFLEESKAPKGFPRAHSDGNLKGLEVEEFCSSSFMRSSRRRPPMLQTIPSFSVYTRTNEDGEVTDEEGSCDGSSEGLEISVSAEDNIASGASDFSFSNADVAYLVEEAENGRCQDMPRLGQLGVSLFCLARGVGFDWNDSYSSFRVGGRGRNNSVPDVLSDSCASDLVNYYQKMVEENPCEPLFLKNYARLLHQTKKDFARAEEYYSRAILADPGDGVILSQYAKLIWEFHQDHERASSYFEQAVQAAPANSHVLAAYASYLWEMEEEDGQSSFSAQDSMASVCA